MRVTYRVDMAFLSSLQSARQLLVRVSLLNGQNLTELTLRIGHVRVSLEIFLRSLRNNGPL